MQWTERELMLAHLIRHLQLLGYTVTHADHSDYPSPPAISRHRPAVVAIDEAGSYAIGDISTKSELLAEQLRGRLRELGSISEARLFLCVPALSRTEVPAVVSDHPNVTVVYYPSFEIDSLLLELKHR